MSLITDIRAVSENAVEQIAARLSELPRPMLAAIGAGEMAMERLADLRESISDSMGDRIPAPSIDITDFRSAASDLGSRVSDLPSRAQKVAADVAGTFEQFAAQAPVKAQEFIAQMPEKVGEFQAAAQSLSPDAVKETVGAYSHLAGMIYSHLADKGDKTWTRFRASAVRPEVDPTIAARVATPTPAATPTPSAAQPSTPKPRAPRASSPKATVPAATPKATVRPAAATPAPVKPARVAPTRVTPTRVTPAPTTPAAVPPAGVKPARKRPAAKSADTVVPKAAPKFVAETRTVRRTGGRTTVTPVAETVIITPVTPQS